MGKEFANLQAGDGLICFTGNRWIDAKVVKVTPKYVHTDLGHRVSKATQKYRNRDDVFSYTYYPDGDPYAQPLYDEYMLAQWYNHYKRKLEDAFKRKAVSFETIKAMYDMLD